MRGRLFEWMGRSEHVKQYFSTEDDSNSLKVQIKEEGPDQGDDGVRRGCGKFQQGSVTGIGEVTLQDERTGREKRSEGKREVGGDG